MLEQGMTGQQGTTPPEEELTGAEGAGAAGAAPEEALTNRQLIDRLVQARGGNEEGINEDQRFRIEQETRNFIDDVSNEFKEEFPDSTNLQRQQFIEGMLEVDAGKILRAVVGAVKTATEQEQAGDGEPKPLNVMRGGSGKSTENAPRSLNEAVMNIAGMFEG